ncbi:Zinc-containing alcohol dehydrogenase superfamily [Shewanella piezotolerans WP3]|uniref:Zinc-containing alcohol dehydrogenase superfamily n=1 Tax=Shewanella piezotolerans (strain WP3 / JCM 13877) TaxID=225849 RepID=B8CQ14_SHEPW|nr:NADP-dependent oxidoreductase [Shewanella piezotolerans]ACJ29877.1 Zinc-containing alcohol dehydrogenase superfamily [Shewanella piezotolerans WP3]
MNAKQIQLKSRPEGLPNANNFAEAEVALAAIKDGEFLVKNLWMSVDPYMRGRMIDRKSYIAPFEIGAVLEGGAIGEVIESNNSEFPVGSKVNSMHGWRSHYVTDGTEITRLPQTPISESHFLGVLGMPGMTAWTGLNRIAELKSGETLFVSAASGAVGSVAVQIGKLMGARVIASVGSDEKAEHIKSLGVDAVINYKTCGDLTAALAQAAPEGIDVYFENVGGEHLTAALNNMKDHGRIAVCGMIAQYNDTVPTPGPANLAQIIMKKLKIEGFIVFEHWAHYPEFAKQMGQWLAEGKVTAEQTVYEGLSNAPEAFIGLFEGKNRGKMIVKLT